MSKKWFSVTKDKILLKSTLYINILKITLKNNKYIYIFISYSNSSCINLRIANQISYPNEILINKISNTINCDS